MILILVFASIAGVGILADKVDMGPTEKDFTCFQCKDGSLRTITLTKSVDWSCQSDGGVLYTNTQAQCEAIHPEYFDTNNPTTKLYTCYQCKEGDLGDVVLVKNDGWSCRSDGGILYTATQSQCESAHPEYFTTDNNDDDNNNNVAGTDKFGIKEIYPTNGMVWFSTWNNGIARSFDGWESDPQDTWFDTDHGDADYRVDGNGNFYISGSTPRMYIHDPALQKSWGDVEVTVYAKRIADSDVNWGGIEAVVRTNHGTTNKPEGNYLCDTRGIASRFRYDGYIDFEKETAHPDSKYVEHFKYFDNRLPYNQWIGYKYVVYDLPNGNVKLEAYMDLTDGKNGGDWKLVNEFIDDGTNFGEGGKACASGIDPKLKLTKSNSRAGSESGKPNITVYFRSDGVGDEGLIYKKMSVREIKGN